MSAGPPLGGGRDGKGPDGEVGGPAGAQRGMDLPSRAPEFRVNLECKMFLNVPD